MEEKITEARAALAEIDANFVGQSEESNVRKAIGTLRAFINKVDEYKEELDILLHP